MHHAVLRHTSSYDIIALPDAMILKYTLTRLGGSETDNVTQASGTKGKNVGVQMSLIFSSDQVCLLPVWTLLIVISTSEFCSDCTLAPDLPSRSLQITII